MRPIRALAVLSMAGGLFLAYRVISHRAFGKKITDVKFDRTSSPAMTTHLGTSDSPTPNGRRAVLAFLIPIGGVFGWATGYIATLELSTLKLTAAVLGVVTLPFLLIHLELGAVLFLGT